MAKLAVMNAVKGVLDAWADCPPRDEANTTGQVDGESALYLLVQFPVANGSRRTHGRDFAEEGAARIVINAPSGSGTDESMRIGEKIASLFRARKIAGVYFLAPSSPLLHDDNDDGAYFKTSVVIPYLYLYDDEESP